MERSADIFKRISNEGEKAIDEFIATRKSEELFLDFKRSSDDGKGPRLSQTDRDNLAKAISGFGNSEGGVIVWGVDCSKDTDGADVAKCRVPIENVHRFVSWLESAVSGCTVPPHCGVRSKPISIGKEGNGFVVTHVPQSNSAPHQVVNKLQYYIRAGSSFIPTPHQVLAGMFGRRPQLNLFPQFLIMGAQVAGNSIESQSGFLIRNEGPGIASDIYITILVTSGIGDNCKISFLPPDMNVWTGMFSLGVHLSLISKPEFRLPPEAYLQSLSCIVVIAPPITKSLKLSGVVGCSNAPPFKFLIEKNCDQVQALYSEFMKKHESNSLTHDDKSNFTQIIFTVAGLEQT